MTASRVAPAGLFDVVTVVFRRKIGLPALQAASLDRFLAEDLVRRILVPCSTAWTRARARGDLRLRPDSSQRLRAGSAKFS